MGVRFDAARSLRPRDVAHASEAPTLKRSIAAASETANSVICYWRAITTHYTHIKHQTTNHSITANRVTTNSPST